MYWTDGGQIVPPQDGAIVSEINSLSFEDIKFNADESLIELIDKKVDEAFIEASVKNGNFNAKGKDDFKIVFTSLHGTSITAIPEVLKRAGYKNVTIIEEQAKPDGNFPTVYRQTLKSPKLYPWPLKRQRKLVLIW